VTIETQLVVMQLECLGRMKGWVEPLLEFADVDESATKGIRLGSE
jgi:hypothetical protein